MVTVLLTTSGTGSRLGDITHFTNKSLVKIGDIYAISRILMAYPSSTEFILTTGHFGSHVKEYIQLAHPELHVQFVDVDNYKDEGSSLGYSMLKAKQHLQKPFYFHCCDTLLKDSMSLVTSNCLFGATAKDSQSYTTIEHTESIVRRLHPKGTTSLTDCYIGIAYIQDWKAFWDSLEKLYEKNPSDSSLNDVCAIQEMISSGIQFAYKEVNKWHDTGNKESLEATKNAFPSKYHVLEKYDESLCFFEDRVIKFFADGNICKKRVERGRGLYPLSPKILGATEHFFVMEKIEGIPLGSSRGYNDVKHLLEWSWEKLWSTKHVDTAFKINCLRFYKTKTYERLSKIPFLQEEKQIVNGIHTGTWQSLLQRVDFEALETDTFTAFHGDFILDNIMKCNDTTFRLLDWRQDFDGNLHYGDMYYDLAKLRHNIYFNHKNILDDLYSVEYNGDTVEIDIKCNFSHICYERDLQHFMKSKGLDSKKVTLLTAIIWLNMSPLYEGKLREFLYYFGKLNIVRALDSPIAVL